MHALAIIPARGGSKGLPGKNVKELAGKPLIVHTIEQAQDTRYVERIVVSTDDTEIATISTQHGAEVVWRPAELAADASSSEDSLLHALAHLEQIDGYMPDIVAFLQCTSPIRTPDDIDSAIQMLTDQRLDSVLSVTSSHAFVWRQTANQLQSVNYDYRNRPRRQDREPEYVENGSIYVFRPWVLKQLNNRLGGQIGLYVMDYWSRFDVDSADDFMMVEWITNHPSIKPCV